MFLQLFPHSKTSCDWNIFSLKKQFWNKQGWNTDSQVTEQLHLSHAYCLNLTPPPPSALPRSFPSRCSRFWVSTSPPAQRRTAQTPRPASRSASSANRRQELLHVTQHVVPLILKSESQKEMYGRYLYMKKYIYTVHDPVKTVVTVCEGQGASLRCFSFNIPTNVTNQDV